MSPSTTPKAVQGRGQRRQVSYPGERGRLFEDIKRRVCEFIPPFLRSVGCR